MKRFFSKNTQQRITALLFVLGIVTYISAYVAFLNSAPLNGTPEYSSLSAVPNPLNNAPGSTESVQGVSDAFGSPEAVGFEDKNALSERSEVKGESTSRVIAQACEGQSEQCAPHLGINCCEGLTCQNMPSGSATWCQPAPTAAPQTGSVDLQVRKMVKSSLGYTVTVCNAGTGTQSIPWLQQGNALV